MPLISEDQYSVLVRPKQGDAAPVVPRPPAPWKSLGDVAAALCAKIEASRKVREAAE